MAAARPGRDFIIAHDPRINALGAWAREHGGSVIVTVGPFACTVGEVETVASASRGALAQFDQGPRAGGRPTRYPCQRRRPGAVESDMLDNFRADNGSTWAPSATPTPGPRPAVLGDRRGDRSPGLASGLIAGPVVSADGGYTGSTFWSTSPASWTGPVWRTPRRTPEWFIIGTSGRGAVPPELAQRAQARGRGRRCRSAGTGPSRRPPARRRKTRRRSRASDNRGRSRCRRGRGRIWDSRAAARSLFQLAPTAASALGGDLVRGRPHHAPGKPSTALLGRISAPVGTRPVVQA